MTLNLPQPDPYGDGTHMTPQMRSEQVADALALATEPRAIARIEEHLHAALDRARAREVPVDWLRDALAQCAVRRTELAADGGQARAAHSAHSVVRSMDHGS